MVQVRQEDGVHPGPEVRLWARLAPTQRSVVAEQQRVRQQSVPGHVDDHGRVTEPGQLQRAVDLTRVHRVVQLVRGSGGGRLGLLERVKAIYDARGGYPPAGDHLTAGGARRGDEGNGPAVLVDQEGGDRARVHRIGGLAQVFVVEQP